MDPVGFALENFDAVGRWRDARGGPAGRRRRAACPTAASSTAWPGWKQALLKRPELFVGTLTEKLLTFALGRGVEYYDAPAVRKIVRDARRQRTIASRR